MKHPADFGIVYSAALGSGIEMLDETLYRVSQLSGVGLQIHPSTFFD
ncbi:MAG: hypothetical protein NC311_10240 [Muribaculaceae bacterium]|nr:hypothetical protein [Muribaculaceae bacterium]